MSEKGGWSRLRRGGVAGLIAALVSLWLGAPSWAEAPRLVLGHYMAFLNVEGYDLSDYRAEIEIAQAHGLDGFVFNFGGPDRPAIRERMERLLTAAAQREKLGAPRFYIVMSPDFHPHGRPPPASDIVALLERYGDHPHYLRHDGRLVLLTWATDSRAPVWWQGLREELSAALDEPVFLMPQLAGLDRGEVEALYGAYGGIADGVFHWPNLRCPLPGACAGEIDSVTRGRWFAARTARDGKPFMAGVAGAYWMKCNPGYSAFGDHQAAAGLIAQWRDIIEVQRPDYVQVVTWNDFGEDSWIYPDTPMVFPDPSAIRRGHVAHGIPNLPKTAFAELTRYFARWYKTGEVPALTTERVLAVQMLDDPRANYGAAAHRACSNSDPDRHGRLERVASVVSLLSAPARIRYTVVDARDGAERRHGAAATGSCPHHSCVEEITVPLAADEQLGMVTIERAGRRLGSMRLPRKHELMDPRLPQFGVYTQVLRLAAP